MWLWDWLRSWLALIGLLPKRGKILFLGLDNAGKTTLLHMLKYGRVSVHSPTSQPQYEEIVLDGLTLRAHDLGGHTAARRIWKSYFLSVDGVVFMVDACDVKRFEEVKTELSDVLNSDSLENVPVLILGNKIDRSGAVTEAELKKYFSLEDACTGKKAATVSSSKKKLRPLEVFMISLWQNAGYMEAFKWLSAYIK